jgi:SNF2 family DNA or RNA helicase
MPYVSHHRLHSLVARWSKDAADLPDPNVLVDLAAVPGVRLESSLDGAVSLTLPRSTWTLPEVQDLVEAPGRGFVPGERFLADGLYPYQQEGLAFLVRNQGGILADQMGLGKTRTAIAAACAMRDAEGPGKPILIVAPRYTRETWKCELAAMGALGAGFWAVEGTRPNEAEKAYGADWWFCHYEILSAWAPVFGVNRRGRPACVVVDEAHWIRNARSKRGKAAQCVGPLAQRVIALTGTPLANRPSDLWALLTLVDGAWSWGSPLDFRQRYCGATHNGFGWMDGQPTFTDELQGRLQTRYLRRTIEDAGVELPPLTRTVVYADLEDAEVAEQKAELASVFGGLSLDEVFGMLTAGGKLGKLVLEALHTLRTRTSAAKIGTTVDYVTSLLQQGESVVLFAWQRETATRLEKTLRKTNTTHLVHGGLSQATREAEVDAFQRGAFGSAVLVSTIDALKEGVTLTRARHVVMHDLSWVPSDVLQAEARVYRISQKWPTTSAWVLARNSFDTLLAQALLRKGAMQSDMLQFHDTENAARDFGLRGSVVASLEEEGARILAQWRGE